MPGIYTSVVNERVSFETKGGIGGVRSVEELIDCSGRDGQENNHDESEAAPAESSVRPRLSSKQLLWHACMHACSNQPYA